MRSTFLNAVSFAAIATFGAASAAAQTNPTMDSETEFNEDAPVIVVTGGKTEQSLQNVTASVNVTTAETIEREPITDLYDVIERVPNVTSSFGEQGFSIRGIDQRGIGGTGATLIVFVDDSPLSNQTTFFGPTDSWDLAQVEVFRGPQSTNFGRNALAGAIYVRTQDPSYDTEVKGRLEYGNNGQRQAALAGGGAIIDDVLAFRIAGNYRETDGFVFNTFLNEPADATEIWTGRFKLLFEPTDNFKIISTSSYTENFAGEDLIDATNGNPGLPVSANQVIREVAYDTPGREGTETFIQSINATWDISDRVQLQLITTYQDTDYLRVEDFDRTPAPIAALDRTGVDEAYSQELRVKYLGDDLTVAGGFYYFENEDGFTDTFTVPATIVNPALPASILIDRVSRTTNETRNFAFFVDGEYALNDTIDVLFGARYDNEQLENTSGTETSVQGGLPPGFDFLAPLLGSQSTLTEADYEAFLPKFGLRLNLSDDANVSFVSQRAYRAGGAQIIVLDGSINEFDPEFLWNYELAFRSIWLDGRLRWNANVYYSDWSDQQVTEPIPGFPTFGQTVNAGQSTLYGFETDFSLDATNELQIYGGIGYAFTQFDDFPNGNFDPAQPANESNQANFDGNRFPAAPRWSGNFGVAYANEDGFFGGIDANFQSEAFAEPSNFAINACCDRLLMNARIGYAWNGFRLSAYIRNALDDDYYSFFNGAEVGNEIARFGNPRTYAVRLDASF
ncbi:MAG: TonB-dependent receptor [Pseudomonadota bacterium]